MNVAFYLIVGSIPEVLYFSSIFTKIEKITIRWIAPRIALSDLRTTDRGILFQKFIRCHWIATS